MMSTKIEEQLDLEKVKIDLLNGIYECSQRGLLQSVKWMSELNHSIKIKKISPENCPNFSENFNDEYDLYLLAKSYFDLKEYDRCAYFIKDCVSPKVRFLYLYSCYLSIEKKKLDNMTDTNYSPDSAKNTALKDLYSTIQLDYCEKKLDGYCLYLYGIVLKKLELNKQALDVFMEAVNLAPLNWSAWQELALVIPNKNKLVSIKLPDHWMKHFFLAYAYLEQLCFDESLEIFNSLSAQGFETNTYIKAQRANLYHNCKEYNKAVETYKELLTDDPYRLDSLDIYSNFLYVQGLKTELADLAHKAVSVDKYRVETCCIIGNYYSLRSEHEKAVLYFERGLKLNPNYLAAWTLMGHEYVEMKNVNAAIQSYRHAIEINKRDYRAWYGLGQTYEIIKMPYYCMYYYKQAQQLRPNDSRMLIALGEIYEKLDKTENALKCYYKACRIGDVEGMVLLKLAKLYDKLNLVDSAALAFTEYCIKEDELKSTNYDEQLDFYNAFQYLANYHLQKGSLDDAYTYAYKCLEHEETKEQGKSLLKTIAARRRDHEIDTAEMDETNNSINDNVNSMSMDMTFSPNP